MLASKRSENKKYGKINIYQLAMENPEQWLDVRTSSVYSQIARTGRHHSKTKARAILVDALNNASKSSVINGKTVVIEPPYIPMKAKDVLICFGNKVDRLGANSQVRIEVPIAEVKVDSTGKLKIVNQSQEKVSI